MDAIQARGLDLVIAFQQLSPGLDGVMRLFTFLGEEDFFALLVPIIYWCVDPTLGLRLLAVLVFSDFLNGLAKWMAQGPRPYWVDARVIALSVEPSYGLPSGHAQTAVPAWGVLARASAVRWAWAGAVTVILGISLSRIYLGVHFLHDVLAGWVIGVAVLLAAVWLEPRLGRALASRPPGARVAAAVLLAAVMLALTLGVRGALREREDPPAWATQAAASVERAGRTSVLDTRRPDGQLADVGIALGAAVGLALRRRLVLFDARGPWRLRLARLALGLVVLAALRGGLAALFPQEPEAIRMVFRVVRYAVMALWLVWLAPWVFVRMRLARQLP